MFARAAVGGVTTKPDDKEQFVKLNCDCGSGGGQYLRRYSLCQCSCGKMWWALRPKRDGPLVAYPWPGDARMERARLERLAEAGR